MGLVLQPHNKTVKAISKSLVRLGQAGGRERMMTDQSEEAETIALVERCLIEVSGVDAQSKSDQGQDEEEDQNGKKGSPLWIIVGNIPHDKDLDMTSIDT